MIDCPSAGEFRGRTDLDAQIVILACNVLCLFLIKRETPISSIFLIQTLPLVTKRVYNLNYSLLEKESLCLIFSFSLVKYKRELLNLLRYFVLLQILFSSQIILSSIYLASQLCKTMDTRNLLYFQEVPCHLFFLLFK